MRQFVCDVCDDAVYVNEEDDELQTQVDHLKKHYVDPQDMEDYEIQSYFYEVLR